MQPYPRCQCPYNLMEHKLAIWGVLMRPSRHNSSTTMLYFFTVYTRFSKCSEFEIRSSGPEANLQQYREKIRMQRCTTVQRICSEIQQSSNYQQLKTYKACFINVTLAPQFAIAFQLEDKQRVFYTTAPVIPIHSHHQQHLLYQPCITTGTSISLDPLKAKEAQAG